MSLELQFQVIIFSFLFGVIFLAIYQLFNIIFYRLKGTLIRFVFEIILFGFCVTVYFIILFIINNAILNIYLPLFILLGAIFYQKYLSFPFLLVYGKIRKNYDYKIEKTKKSIYNKINKLKNFLKRKWRSINEKIATKSKEKK